MKTFPEFLIRFCSAVHMRSLSILSDSSINTLLRLNYVSTDEIDFCDNFLRSDCCSETTDFFETAAVEMYAVHEQQDF